MDIQISIIIVNFNTSNLLADCLDSIIADSEISNTEIIVVDNNSIDDSIRMLETRYPMVQMISNTHNAGFSAANNQGLRKASGEFVLLLNPDTIVIPGCLKKLLEFMLAHPHTGACGPHTWLDRSGSLEVCSLKILTPERARAVFTRLPDHSRKKILQSVWDQDINLWTTTIDCPVEGIGGAAIFMRRKVLEKLGGLDERFFMGYEDTDLCAALHQINMSIFVVQNAHIVHLFGQAKKLPQAPARTVYSWQMAPLLFIEKHYGSSAGKRFRFQRRLDSIWRRLTSLPSSGKTRLSDHQGIRLEWKPVIDARYIIEISNEHNFFDKFGKVTDEPYLEIDSEILSRLNGSRWFWRVWSLKPASSPKLLTKGSWHQLQK